MFMHGSWDHILGTCSFSRLRKDVERRIRPLRYLGFYFAGGFVAMMAQTLMTLVFGTAAEARMPNLGASGAIAAVLGAFFVLYRNSKCFGLIVIFPCGSRPGSSSASGSSTSCSRRTSGSSRRPLTVAESLLRHVAVPLRSRRRIRPTERGRVQPQDEGAVVGAPA